MRYEAALGLLMLAAGLCSASAQAQIHQPASVLAAGGRSASGPGYAASGTLGQPIAGRAVAAAYANGAGFWYQVAGLSSAPPPVVTRYVAPTGSDGGNDCTDALNPCATLTHAVAQANDGDTIDVAAGTYAEPGLWIDKKVFIQGAGVIVQ